MCCLPNSLQANEASIGVRRFGKNASIFFTTRIFSRAKLARRMRALHFWRLMQYSRHWREGSEGGRARKERRRASKVLLTKSRSIVSVQLGSLQCIRLFSRPAFLLQDVEQEQFDNSAQGQLRANGPSKDFVSSTWESRV